MNDDLKRLQELFAKIHSDFPMANIRLVIETLGKRHDRYPGWRATLDACYLGLFASAIPPLSIDDERGWLCLRDADGKLTVTGGPHDLDRVLHSVWKVLDDFLNTRETMKPKITDEIKQVFNKFDPFGVVGVMGDEDCPDDEYGPPDDEYDFYILPVLWELENGRPSTEIAVNLSRHIKIFGVRCEIERCERAVFAIRKLYKPE